MTGRKPSILHAYKGAIRIVVRDLEPRGTVAVGPGIELAPTDDSRVKLAFLEEERSGCLIQVWPDEILFVFFCDEF